MIEPQQYDKLIAEESAHWGEVDQDPENPQIWHDPGLFAIFFGKEYQRLVDHAVAAGPRILELGCGEGALSLELATRGMSVTGIDLSAKRIERAAARARMLQVKIPPTFQTGDLNTISLPPNTFDCVVAHDSLHHILNLGRLCDEVKQALKPRGQFVLVDYVGMGTVRKLIAAILYALLPTYQPYRVKWGLRRRLKSFLATEEQKRKALEQSTAGTLHHDSPFEEISQKSIVNEIRSRFQVMEFESFCPFWFYLAAKIKIPGRLKYATARTLRTLDDMMVALRLSEGAYVWIAASARTQSEEGTNATPTL